MLVPVVNVREVRMLVGDRGVPVLMHMRFPSIPVDVMRMLMVIVMPMHVAMRHGLMPVLVLMSLGQMQPHTEGHEHAGQPEPGAHRFAQQPQ